MQIQIFSLLPAMAILVSWLWATKDNQTVIATGTSANSRTIPDTTKMALVKGGNFFMGSMSFANEMPVHEVVLKDFYMDKQEVTVAEYRAFCEATNRDMPREPEWGWQDAMPMVNVTWNDAKAYADWKKQRLPTEAEWEYAARGGNKSQGYIYSGSNYPEVVAWFDLNSLGGPQPVRKRQSNELGIFDMSGNVWEWCSDYYAPYKEGKQENPFGAEVGVNRVTRGGCWFGARGTLRTVNRYYHSPNFGSSLIGFRLVMDIAAK
ncbi:MAG: formylglycine-generating enzyme family protein [Cytophagales bacterium]|nr:MAG: formylglycine-generating enzyme family protein [Cytophagales bacterium]TAF59256.1 MAG: formylglycine-generating enzyme family protein [Cytophagales bacterium]